MCRTNEPVTDWKGEWLGADMVLGLGVRQWCCPEGAVLCCAVDRHVLRGEAEAAAEDA